MPKHGWKFPYGADARITSGCSKRLSSKAAASEEARRTLRYVEPLSDARTPLPDFFSILLNGYSWCRCAVHIEDTAVIEWLLTYPERNVER